MSKSLYVKVDLRRVPRKVQKIVHDPRVIKKLSETWLDKFSEFLPSPNGLIAQSAKITEDGYIKYDTEFAHYYWAGDEFVYDIYPGEKNGEVHKDYFAPKGEKKMPSGDKLKEVTSLANTNYSPRWNEKAYEVYSSEVAEIMTKFIAEL